ncbi:hypothetical protein EHI8A_111730 [Entamoeba histolytica HM-1:IMSS-B]|uniref:Uncharacterized protein n=6 Tax=Entamoeba histolytica TaxID=5759 RepID=C4M039_ENTH1|nr:hypothetical protein EHI_021240 [Entamoeba histolytica HM-1:IMSS]EMD45982.1 Hypothetical protein EHI5A_035240 [Entamoeba histolytica KU27]EMH73106.1 hypothetical protein EHI8A_111730 [Entamoeba histolytica HM-1:IMSS-B]EMS12825.1 hypothetical protein KM1_156010 [Entamoeba histolytica HM-3:IMSS]ENY60777.1 hypothetical protein EHI7A_104940 [Entamoeba histolytica HM-1:IMSS-A]GAT94508.1 hypothetical protein CL6EHI_021240 [Entamoeba histolytica]|eukprot:XP_655362.1 hypothetical protein EHI_021240 [Entamoeba histolytica HM-1:IMSS]
MSYKSKYHSEEDEKYEKKDEEIKRMNEKKNEDQIKEIENQNDKKKRGTTRNGYRRTLSTEKSSTNPTHSNENVKYQQKERGSLNKVPKQSLKEEEKQEKEIDEKSKKEIKEEEKVVYKSIKSDELKEYQQENKELLINENDQLSYIRQQIKNTEQLLEQLKKEEQRLKGKVTEGKSQITQNENIVVDVMCILPNGKQIWININKDDDPNQICKNLSNEYLLSKESEQKLLNYIIEAQHQ